MATSTESTITTGFSAPSNIAVIKYWGKRDKKYNLPINSSVSVTMNQDDLKAITTVVASPAFDTDRLWLNGTEEDVAGSKRIQKVLAEIRQRAGSRKDDQGNEISAETLKTYRVKIVSRNTFPTAAGLASSAAGYACLTTVLADAFAVTESYPGELTTIARMGSGSACRSLYGGFVRWNQGKDAEGKDSFAQQIADEHHWKELEIIILVVSDKKKETGSTVGMDASVATSPLLAYRAEHVVEPRLAEMEAAYVAKDFPTFARISMQDSNQFHATCLDTYPPIFYMNDTSKQIISLCHQLNAGPDGVIVGYTFDAGPNAVIFVERKNRNMVLKTALQHFGPIDPAAVSDFVSDPKIAADAMGEELPDWVPAAERSGPSGVQYVYHTTVGDGPRKLSAEELAKESQV